MRGNNSNGGDNEEDINHRKAPHRNNKYRKAQQYYASQRTRVKWQRQRALAVSNPNLLWRVLKCSPPSRTRLPSAYARVEGFWNSYFNNSSCSSRWTSRVVVDETLSERLVKFGSRVCNTKFTSALYVSSSDDRKFLLHAPIDNKMTALMMCGGDSDVGSDWSRMLQHVAMSVETHCAGERSIGEPIALMALGATSDTPTVSSRFAFTPDVSSAQDDASALAYLTLKQRNLLSNVAVGHVTHWLALTPGRLITLSGQWMDTFTPNVIKSSSAKKSGSGGSGVAFVVLFV